MKLKLFYSWQAETDKKLNRFFILDCIKIAVENLKKDPEIKDIEIEIHEGVTGEPGSAPPSGVIMDKRIPNSDIFISDLSIVNRYPEDMIEMLKARGVPYRPGPNSNVMIELGIAQNKLGPEKIIFVMNNAYGSPQDNAEYLPFDIRSYRWPIEYHCSDPSMRATAKGKLVGGLTGAIKDAAIYAVQNYQQKYRPFMTWAKWSGYISQKQPFTANEKLLQIMADIRSAVENGKADIRFLGLPGLGKTRVVFEIFRPISGDAASTVLSGRVLYADCNRNDKNVILQKIEDIVSEGSEHVVILDNCNLSFYRDAINLIQNRESKASLITISPEPEEFMNNKITGISYHLLKKEDLTSVVDEILERDFNALSEENKRTIRDFAQGIPMMAVLLGESAVNGEEFIGKLDDKHLLDKLLGDAAKDPENRKLLQTSALFNYFGFEDEVEDEFKFLASDQNLTITDHAPETSRDNFRRLINHYLKREIYEQRGRYVGMRPFPLAWSLATEWLENCTSDRILKVIIAIAGLNEPHRKHLAEAFSDQMKYLGYNERAVAIVNKITGPDSPFDNAEVLNTELGSRFFRSFVEVSPVSVADNLYRNFAFLPIAKLEQVVEGRRNLVWVLENLCFGDNTFDKSVKVLFAFAAAENETWGNNATGQLLQLFSAHLPGTEVPLLKRINVIKWALERDDKKFRELAVRAIGRGLTFIHAHRMNGPENQGMVRREDYVPSDEEIRVYWRQLLELLTSIILNEPELADQATEILSDSIREIVLIGNGDLLIQPLSIVADFKNNDWNHALDNIRLTLQYERNMGESLQNDFNTLVNRLNKTDFKSKYLRALEHKMDKFPDEMFSYEAFAKYTEKLAGEFLGSGLNWEETIPMFFLGKQYHTFYFGKGIADELQNQPEKLKLFIDKSLEFLNTTTRSETDPTVLGGIFRFANENTRKYIKDKVMECPKLAYLLFYLTSFENDSYDKTEPLFELIDSGEYQLSEFAQFRLNGPAKTDEDVLIRFSHKLFTYGKEGYKVAYQIIFGLTYFSQEKSPALLQTLKECVVNMGVFNDYITGHDYHQWWETIRLILKNETESDFAIVVNDAVIESITLENSYHLDYDLQKTYEVLMSRHFNKVWPGLSNALLSQKEQYIKFYGLKHILESGISTVKRPVGVLFDGNIDVIFKWCAENPPLAPGRLAELVPIFAAPEKDKTATWHPYAKRLIDEFGQLHEVRDALNANMNTFSWSGSIEPYLRNQLALMNELLDHPKPEVAEWATKYADYLKLEIERTIKRDQEDMII